MEYYLLRALYIILSATLIFLPLTVVFPSWMNLIPFYRKAMSALDKIFQLGEEVELPFPSGVGKQRVTVGFVKVGDKGFKEVLSLIKAHRPEVDVGVSTIGLAYGRISLSLKGFRGIAISPNYLLYTQRGDKDINSIMFNPSENNSAWMREDLANLITATTQRRVAIATAIVGMLWIATTTLLVFG